MKYQNLKSFQKHLASAAPDHLSRLYLLAVPDDFERARGIEAVLSCLKGSPTRLSGADCSLRDALDAMQSLTLFGDTPIVVLDEVEKLGKKEVQQLADHLSAQMSYIILGSRSKTAVAVVAEKEGVVLDLLDEKPWDKEKRLVDQLIERAKGMGKRLLAEEAHFLLERLGNDAALLESEIDKLICYAGDRGTITREDILAISPVSKMASLWQQAEEVIWEGGEFPMVDATAFHTLIPALRSQLHIGLTLAALIEEKRPAEEWSRFLPKLWPKTLEKRSSQAAHLGAPFFRRGLEKLFEIELLSRTNSTQYRALLDLFRVHLYAR